MLFTVLPADSIVPTTEAGKAYLVRDNWNDWFEWYTMLTLFVVDQQNVRRPIGSVKIAHNEMPPGRVPLPADFDELPEEYFSLGQDENYYESLFGIEEGLRQRIFAGLRDVVVDGDRFERWKDVLAMRRSLLRGVSEESVTGRFRRLARGEATLTPFRFTYSLPGTTAEPPTITFNVVPESTPPTNVHVIIGRNGVGKTRCMQLMTLSLLETKPNDSLGKFVSLDTKPLFGGRVIDNVHVFKNVVSVTFSAFDPFESIDDTKAEPLAIPYSYIGLKSGKVPLSKAIDAVLRPGDALPKTDGPKNVDQLVSDFSNSVKKCRIGVRAERWKRALSILEGDPLFRDADITSLANSIDENTLDSISRRTFSLLSSGHKIVLLTITRLVETVEEKTLVFLDEPEAHLHPPLLSAFVRSLSDLMSQRNGVAIIATHSPVILQEVPKSCVSILSRSGRIVRVESTELETFGENVGILTQEVFGLEVTHSGFHKMLLNETKSSDTTYESVLTKFNYQLGVEAKSILRGILASRNAARTE